MRKEASNARHDRAVRHASLGSEVAVQADRGNVRCPRACSLTKDWDEVSLAMAGLSSSRQEKEEALLPNVRRLAGNISPRLSGRLGF